MSYGDNAYAVTVHGTPPVQHEANRRCERCASKVSRYQKKYHGTLLCFRCQNERLHGAERVHPERVHPERVCREQPKYLTGLRGAMRRRGVSQKVLATRLGASPQSISELSRGVERASPERATRIALALGAEVEELTA